MYLLAWNGLEFDPVGLLVVVLIAIVNVKVFYILIFKSLRIVQYVLGGGDGNFACVTVLLRMIISETREARKISENQRLKVNESSVGTSSSYENVAK